MTRQMLCAPNSFAVLDKKYKDSNLASGWWSVQTKTTFLSLTFDSILR